MKRVSITQAKNGLSALIDGLKGGSPVLIVDRGRPVARLEPVTGDGQDDRDGLLSQLIRDGIVRPARVRMTRPFLLERLPSRRGKPSVVAALVEERREGR